MTPVNSIPPTSLVSAHLGEMHALVRVSAIYMCTLCIFWSFFVEDLVLLWIDILPIESGPSNENLSVYAPFDWVQMRWDIVIMLSLVSLMPILSIQLYRFSRMGLYPRERSWLIAVLLLSTTIVPISILSVWFYAIPSLFELASVAGVPIGVGVRYDASSVFSLAIGVSWVMVVWSVTVLLLALTRLFGLVSNGKPRFRNRMFVISAGTLVLTLPVEFDGLRLLLGVVVVALADMVAGLVPVFKPNSGESANFDSNG